MLPDALSVKVVVAILQLPESPKGVDTNAVAKTWRRVWGDGKFFVDQDDVFFWKIFILAAKIPDDLF